MLDQPLAEAMQKMLASADERFPLTATRQRLIDAGIGTRRGRSVFVSPKDREEMRAWLAAKGYATSPTALDGKARSERLALTTNEKAGGAAVKNCRISVKALAGQPLLLGDERLFLPARCHLDADWRQLIGKIGHRSLMLVENYENFDRIEETAFDFGEFDASPLLIYRGDPHESRLDNVLQFLAQVDLPVLAFMDIDPAGIATAAKLPRLAGMLAPEATILEPLLAAAQSGRRDLFQAQYAVHGQQLDDLGSEHPGAMLWLLLVKHRSAVVQERWIGSGTRCVVW